MPPQFGRVVTVSVMAVLVALFTWIYLRDRRQQRVRLWMMGWTAIMIHFGAALLGSFNLIPPRLSDWMAYSTLLAAAACFFLSVTEISASPRDLALYLGGNVIPGIAYWTCLVFDVKTPGVYRGLLALSTSVFCFLVLLDRHRAERIRQFAMLSAIVLSVGAVYSADAHPEYGMDLMLFGAFAATGHVWWEHYRRVSPGILLTSVSFLAWGLVFPVAELLAALHFNIPGDHVVWDLPKYFVAFGMIVTLFENQAEMLQLEIRERKRAEEAAQAASHAKSIFLASMSHEIRTPMNGIIGMAEVVLESHLSTEQRENLTIVRSSAESLLMVINDILDFSKIEAGRLEFESIRFPLHDHLYEIVRNMSFRAQQKGLELICDIRPGVPEYVQGDPGRLGQVLMNLLGNAIKFTAAGEVTLSVRTESGDPSELRFAVIDTGIGIPEDKRGLIFEAFRQADDSTTRKFGGTGLGLAISSRLVEMMHGKISVETGPSGAGSAFHFTARFAAAELAPPAPHPPLDFPVLIVDDNAASRRFLSDWCERWGLHPEAAADGPSALALLAGRRASGKSFGLVVLDARMPGMDGWETAAELRGARLDAPVILMTPLAAAPGIERSRALGIDASVHKPLRPAELLRAMLKVLAPAPASRAPGLPPPFQPLRILVAEDNPVNRKVASSLVERLGHSPVVVDNGRAALDAIARESFDAVLMDVQMPEMDGFEATAILREQERGTGLHLPVIAVTAHAMAGDEQRCLDAGMDAYISKPIDSERLAELIDAMAGRFAPTSAYLIA